MAMKSFKNIREMFDKVKESVEESKNKKFTNKDFSMADGKRWKPTAQKGENVSKYVVRFLPNPYSETGKPFVIRKLHGFGPEGNKLYENCPWSIGKKCPICLDVNPMFKSENPTDKDMAYKRYGKKRYFANVYIVSDPRENGAMEGKVYIWEMGKKLGSKLEKAIDEDFVFYDPYEGADFNVEVKTVKDFPNYDASDFSRKTTKLLDGDDEKLNEVCGQCYDLEKEILGEENFRTFEQIEERYSAYNRGEQVSNSFPKNDKQEQESDNSVTKKSEPKNEEQEEVPDLIGQIEEAREEMQSDDKSDDAEENTTEEEPTETSDDEDFDIDIEEFEEELKKSFPDGE